MSMFRKYLLKKEFWAVARKDGQNNCYVKHDIHAGGIYAYLQNQGVKIVTGNETRFFSNFDDLDMFLDRLSLPKHSDPEDFFSVLHRRNNARLLRKIPL